MGQRHMPVTCRFTIHPKNTRYHTLQLPTHYLLAYSLLSNTRALLYYITLTMSISTCSLTYTREHNLITMTTQVVADEFEENLFLVACRKT